MAVDGIVFLWDRTMRTVVIVSRVCIVTIAPNVSLVPYLRVIRINESMVLKLLPKKEVVMSILEKEQIS